MTGGASEPRGGSASDRIESSPNRRARATTHRAVERERVLEPSVRAGRERQGDAREEENRGRDRARDAPRETRHRERALVFVVVRAERKFQEKFVVRSVRSERAFDRPPNLVVGTSVMCLVSESARTSKQPERYAISYYASTFAVSPSFRVRTKSNSPGRRSLDL